MTQDTPRKQESFAPLVEPVLTYLRTLRFTGPEQLRRYYRLFGEMEHDLLSLRAELAAVDLRLREVRRRIERGDAISQEDERRICSVAHELTEHLYHRAESYQALVDRVHAFRFDPERERQALVLLADIATAVLGIADSTLRGRQMETLHQASDAYGRLDIATLVDLHDSVQQLVGVQRRERLDPVEEQQWRHKLHELWSAPPLSSCTTLDDPRLIAGRMQLLKSRIERRQRKLEERATVYLAAVKVGRFRN